MFATPFIIPIVRKLPTFELPLEDLVVLSSAATPAGEKVRESKNLSCLAAARPSQQVTLTQTRFAVRSEGWEKPKFGREARRTILGPKHYGRMQI